MPHTLSIRINPECLNFLNQTQKNLSLRQNTFFESIKDLHTTVNQLKKQPGSNWKLDEKLKAEISRGAFYAMTPSLETKFTQQHVITLPDLRNVLNNEFRIKNELTVDFIIKSLLEPHSVPFALSILAFSVLTEDSIWSNHCTTQDSKFKYSLKAKIDHSEDILFKIQLDLKSTNLTENPPMGSSIIQFCVNPQQQIKLLPLTLNFNFPDKKEFKQFKKELYRDFQDWIFWPKTHWQITDLWVIPVLLGCLLGIITMMSLLALSLTPISPFLLPPLGFALGLGLASVMHSYVHINIKKEQAKLQRPIHLFNKESAFFNLPQACNRSTPPGIRLNSSQR